MFTQWNPLHSISAGAMSVYVHTVEPTSLHQCWGYVYVHTVEPTSLHQCSGYVSLCSHSGTHFTPSVLGLCQSMFTQWNPLHSISAGAMWSMFTQWNPLHSISAGAMWSMFTQWNPLHSITAGAMSVYVHTVEPTSLHQCWGYVGLCSHSGTHFTPSVLGLCGLCSHSRTHFTPSVLGLCGLCSHSGTHFTPSVLGLCGLCSHSGTHFIPSLLGLCQSMFTQWNKNEHQVKKNSTSKGPSSKLYLIKAIHIVGHQVDYLTSRCLPHSCVAQSYGLQDKNTASYY